MLVKDARLAQTAWFVLVACGHTVESRGISNQLSKLHSMPAKIPLTKRLRVTMQARYAWGSTELVVHNVVVADLDYSVTPVPVVTVPNLERVVADAASLVLMRLLQSASCLGSLFLVQSTCSLLVNRTGLLPKRQ